MVQPTAQDRHVGLLQYQIQQYLDQLRPECFEVRTDALIEGAYEFQPALFIVGPVEPDSEPAVRWVINIADSSVPGDRSLEQQSLLCARLAIADYWLLTPSQSALRTYSIPGPSGYEQQRLWHVGERVSPASIPEISLRLQEPLPLYFLTRTLKGQRTYASSALPLQVL